MELKVQPPEWAMWLARQMALRGIELYMVGGWVRDSLLGRQSPDVDMCGPALPEEIERAAEDLPQVKLIPRSSELGTVEVRVEWNGEHHSVEYTAFRRESYKRGEHRPASVTLGATLQEDCLRRDFRMNAVYLKLPEKTLIDPLDGLDDIERGIMRTTRSPRDVFGEDGLRLMRLARQHAQLGFVPQADVLEAAKECAALIEDIVPTRIRDELELLLLADGRRGDEQAVVQGLTLLSDIGVLGRILPALTAGDGLAQRAQYHDFDVMRHQFYACARAPRDITLRLAALLHDVGKPMAAAQNGNMHRHEQLGAPVAQQALLKLCFAQKQCQAVRELVRWHMYDLNGNTGLTKLRRLFVTLGYERAQQLIWLRRADFWGSRRQKEPGDPAERWQQTLDKLREQNVPESPAGLNIRGDRVAEIMGERPGPRTGRMLHALWLVVVDHPAQNKLHLLEGHIKRLMKNETSWDRPAKYGE